MCYSCKTFSPRKSKVHPLCTPNSLFCSLRRLMVQSQQFCLCFSNISTLKSQFTVDNCSSRVALKWRGTFTLFFTSICILWSQRTRDEDADEDGDGDVGVCVFGMLKRLAHLGVVYFCPKLSPSKDNMFLSRLKRLSLLQLFALAVWRRKVFPLHPLGVFFAVSLIQVSPLHLSAVMNKLTVTEWQQL